MSDANTLVTVVVLLAGVVLLALLHCWSLSTLFAWRFGLVARLGWVVVVLVPLLGPLAYLLATRRFRAQERPSARRQIVCFAAVAASGLAVVGAMSIQQFREFNRGAADAQAYMAIKDARALVEGYLADKGRVPPTLDQAGFKPASPEIHVNYTPQRERGYELTSFHGRGGKRYRAVSGLDVISREPR